VHTLITRFTAIGRTLLMVARERRLVSRTTSLLLWSPDGQLQSGKHCIVH
jgi:hypothetical protein